jgi:hypothetical protein
MLTFIRAFLLLVAVSISAQALAAKFIPAKIIFTDGKVLTGFATPPDKPTDKKIAFKATEKGEKVIYNSELLKTVVFTYEDGVDEYDRVKTYNMSGKKLTDPVWLLVLNRGYTTLYFAVVDGQTMVRSTGMSTTPSDKYWLCMREGEEGAAIVSWVIGKINANGTFKVKAAEYFKDYAELSEKIKDKTYTYKDINEVVKEYNTWKTKKPKAKKTK